MSVEHQQHPNPNDPQNFENYVRNLVGAVALPRVFLGSGVKVILPAQPGREDGRVGLLTAIHVVLPALLSGQRFGVILPTPTNLEIEPTAIRFAPNSDAAVLTLPRATNQTDALVLNEWNPRLHTVPAASSKVYPCGFPGSRVYPADLATQTSGRLELHLLEMDISGNLRRLILATSPEDPRFTATFRGMSGGPVFDSEGELVGINTLEIRNHMGTANIAFTSRPDWEGLFHPAIHPIGVPGDLDGFPQSRHFRLGLFNANTQKSGPPFDAIVRGHVYRSRSMPAMDWGTFGSVESIEIPGNRYPINVESMYRVNDPNDRATWEQEFMVTVANILGTMSLVNL